MTTTPPPGRTADPTALCIIAYALDLAALCGKITDTEYRQACRAAMVEPARILTHAVRSFEDRWR